MGKFLIEHLTEYTYSNVIRENAFKLAIYPLPGSHVSVLHHIIQIPFNPPIYLSTDYFGNTVGQFTINEPHDKLGILSLLHVETDMRDLPTPSGTPAEHWNELESLRNDFNYFDFLQVTDFTGLSKMKDELKEIQSGEPSPFELAKQLSAHVHDTFSYEKGVTHVDSGLDEVWAMHSGVCQDFTHICLEFLRLAGIPARYVSGYICPVNHDMIGEGATHAWAEAWLPEYGWTGFDPTNNCLADDKHIRIATGRGYTDCSPVKGVYRGNATNMLEVSVKVQYDLDDFPNVPNPFPTGPAEEKQRNRFMENMEAMQQQQQ